LEEGVAVANKQAEQGGTAGLEQSDGAVGGRPQRANRTPGWHADY